MTATPPANRRNATKAATALLEFLCLTVIGPVVAFFGCAFFPFGPVLPLLGILVFTILRSEERVAKPACLTGLLAALAITALFSLYAWLIYDPHSSAVRGVDGSIKVAGVTLAELRKDLNPIATLKDDRSILTPPDYVYVLEDKMLEAEAAMAVFLSAGWIGLMIWRPVLTLRQLFMYAAVYLYSYILLGSSMSLFIDWRSLGFSGFSRYGYEAIVFYTFFSSMALLPILMGGYLLGRGIGRLLRKPSTVPSAGPPDTTTT